MSATNKLRYDAEKVEAKSGTVIETIYSSLIKADVDERVLASNAARSDEERRQFEYQCSKPRITFEILLTNHNKSRSSGAIAEDAYRRLLLEEVSVETKWLDLGCGWQLLRDWLKNCRVDQVTLSSRAKLILGIDAVKEDVSRNVYLHQKLVGDLAALPVRDSSFDLVTAQMVVEHLPVPGNVLGEVKRVLKPGGKFIFLTPNFANYQFFVASFLPDGLKKKIVFYLEGRAENDIFKTYYRFNTVNSIRKFARQHGLTVERIQMLHSPFEFPKVPPLFRIEKALQKLLDKEQFAGFRSKMLGILVKPSENLSSTKPI